MRKEKIINLDCDGILCDFVGSVCDWLSQRHNVIVSDKDIVEDYRKQKFECPSKDDPEKIIKFDWDYVDEDHCLQPEFCFNLKPYPGAVEFIDNMKETGATILFVTSPYRNHKTWASERIRWVEKHFGFSRDHVISTSSKQYVYGDIFVDDLLSHSVAWGKFWNKRSIFFDRPWNDGQFLKFMANDDSFDNLSTRHNDKRTFDFWPKEGKPFAISRRSNYAELEKDILSIIG